MRARTVWKGIVATLRPVFSATGSSFRIEFILSRNRCSVRWTTVRGGAVSPTVIPLLSLYQGFSPGEKIFHLLSSRFPLFTALLVAAI